MTQIINSLAESVDNSYVIQWLIMLVLLIWVLSKIIPPIITAFNTARNKVNYGEDIVDKVQTHDKDIKVINDKLARDYSEINGLKAAQNQIRLIQNESLEERALIMESLLAIIDGLQEVESPDSTKDVQKKLHSYLNKQAHQEQQKQEIE